MIKQATSDHRNSASAFLQQTMNIRNLMPGTSLGPQAMSALTKQSLLTTIQRPMPVRPVQAVSAVQILNQLQNRPQNSGSSTNLALQEILAKVG